MEADKDRDGKISFEEFTKMVENTDVSMSMTLGEDFLTFRINPSVPSAQSFTLQSFYLIRLVSSSGLSAPKLTDIPYNSIPQEEPVSFLLHFSPLLNI